MKALILAFNHVLDQCEADRIREQLDRVVPGLPVFIIDNCTSALMVDVPDDYPLPPKGVVRDV